MKLYYKGEFHAPDQVHLHGPHLGRRITACGEPDDQDVADRTDQPACFQEGVA